jgi:hypothetical protein
MCAILSTPVSVLLSMMDPDHSSMGSRGIVTLTSHLSKPWAMDSPQQKTRASPSFVEHSQEPRAVLAHGTQSPILGKVEVGVIVHLHLKRRYKNVTSAISIAQQVNTEICMKVNSSK